MKYRLYKNTIIGSRTDNTRKSVRILLSWIDRRCDKCGRFISKFSNVNKCNNCSDWNDKEYRATYMTNVYKGKKRSSVNGKKENRD